MCSSPDFTGSSEGHDITSTGLAGSHNELAALAMCVDTTAMAIVARMQRVSLEAFFLASQMGSKTPCDCGSEPLGPCGGLWGRDAMFRAQSSAPLDVSFREKSGALDSGLGRT